MLEYIKLKDNYLGNRMMFKEASFERMNLLYGGNGSGKSSLIQAICGMAITKNDSYHESRNLTPGITHKLLNYINSESNLARLMSTRRGANTDLVAEGFVAQEFSEGQSIIYSIYDLFEALMDKFNNTLCPQEDNVEYVVVIDEIDSGLSVNYIDQICVCIKKILKYRSDVQFFISSNNYAFLPHFPRVFSMYTGDFIYIDTYDKFCNGIITHHELVLNHGKKLRTMDTKFSNSLSLDKIHCRKEKIDSINGRI